MEVAQRTLMRCPAWERLESRECTCLKAYFPKAAGLGGTQNSFRLSSSTPYYLAPYGSFKMKERTTLIHEADDTFDPAQLELHHDRLRIKSLKAAREDRIISSLYELPQEVIFSKSSRVKIRFNGTRYGQS